MEKRIEDLSVELIKMSENECFDLLDIILDMKKEDIIKFVTGTLDTLESLNYDISSRWFQMLPVSRIFYSNNAISDVMSDFIYVTLDDTEEIVNGVKFGFECLWVKN